MLERPARTDGLIDMLERMLERGVSIEYGVPDARPPAPAPEESPPPRARGGENLSRRS